MKLTYKVTEQELFDFNLFRVFNRNPETITRALMVSAGYLLVLLLLAYFFRMPWWMYVIIFATSAILFLGILLFLRSRMKRSIRIMLYRQNKDDIMPETTIDISNESEMIIIKNDKETEISYDSIERVEATDKFLYVIMSEHREFFIPRRCFSEISMSDFVQKLKENAPSGVFIVR